MKIIITSFFLFTTVLLLAQSNSINPQLDSVFKKSGEVLVGKIIIDKDRDRFILEGRDTFTMELFAPQIKYFTYNDPEHRGEKTTYHAILNEFYFLEFGQKDPMQAWARYVYQPVENDGPKYYVVKKKYCFFKGKVPFFPKQESFKNDFLLLIDDCPKVSRKIANRDIKIEELVDYVIEYNNCNGKKKK
ncbi:MAG: hypothetical protein JNL70_08310 [Saprospiraceae bacterium]|nr:hypothetical protein [Saprospiraceae bacterium]